MYRRWKKKRYYNNQLNILEMLVEIIAGLFFILGKLIYKLILKVFHRGIEIKKGSFGINNAPSTQIYDSKTPLPTASDEGVRYGLKQSLLSPSEKNFLDVLKQVVGDRYVIENQVQLSRIVTPLDSNSNFTNYRDFNQIKAKSIDFVLFDKNYKPYLCLELDDKSHLRWDRMKRDAFVDAVMKDVGLRIIHIRASYSYNPEDLGKQIFQ